MLPAFDVLNMSANTINMTVVVILELWAALPPKSLHAIVAIKKHAQYYYSEPQTRNSSNDNTRSRSRCSSSCCRHRSRSRSFTRCFRGTATPQTRLPTTTTVMVFVIIIVTLVHIIVIIITTVIIYEAAQPERNMASFESPSAARWAPRRRRAKGTP